jgi:hypothetical protein
VGEPHEGRRETSRSYVIRFGGREISCPGRRAYLTFSIPPGVLYIDDSSGLSRPTESMVQGEVGRGQQHR